MSADKRRAFWGSYYEAALWLGAAIALWFFSKQVKCQWVDYLSTLSYLGFLRTGYIFIKHQVKHHTTREYAEALIIALLLALTVRAFVLQAFKIPSGSMIPTLQIGDHILVNKFVYWLREPHRGDIIVFKYPLDENRDFIKRIIALPGETLEVKNKKIYINGKPLTESYAVYSQVPTSTELAVPKDNYGPLVLGPGQYFMMGDNRDSSMDSRWWGPLDKCKIKGKAFIIYWSWMPDENAPSLPPMVISRPDTIPSFLWSLIKRIGYDLWHIKDRSRWERIAMMVN
jgi:signal peptidase I